MKGLEKDSQMQLTQF